MKMTQKINGRKIAQQLLTDCGLDEITDMELGLFVAGLDAILIEEELSHCDGKIIFGKNKAVIKVNSKINYEHRKRFTIAHEIGHLLMHRNMELPEDTFSELNMIAGMEKFLKNGRQELEANEFASELLMPENLFVKEAKKARFSPYLIRQLADRFNTSLTATVFRYLSLNLHPLCIFFIENGKVKYWKKSEELKVWVRDMNKLPPPDDSVATEYIESNYDFIYKLDEKAQSISKSTWFELNGYEDDSEFYEYCIPTKQYKTIISIIWED